MFKVGELAHLTVIYSFENQGEDIVDENELEPRIKDYEQVESGYKFNTVTKVVIKVFRNHGIKASSYCKLPKPFCDSEYLVKKQNLSFLTVFLSLFLCSRYTP